MPREPIYVYRGLHAGHPAIASARNGVVMPGDVEGTVTPEEHNAGYVSERSPYTSWSRSLGVALQYSMDNGAGGLILRCAFTSFDEEYPEGANWQWIKSQDIYGEDEILLRGIRIGVEVMK